jgi:hypothetical protein
MNVLSIPFNLRFESLIARLNEHKLLFAIELRAGKHESLNIFVENVIEDLRKRRGMNAIVSVQRTITPDSVSVC